MSDNSRDYRTGLISITACMVLWGVLPVYWQALRPIDSWVIIFYRIFLVGLVSGIASLKLYGIGEIKRQLCIKGNAWKFPLAGLLVTSNWSIYIWAVNADHVIQTCVGYYIEPLMVCLFGIILFKEKLTRYKLVAMLFGMAGLTVILVHFMEPPLIATGIALTFSIYSAVKKWFNLPAILSVFMETIFLMFPALGVVIWMECTGQGALAAATPGKFALLLCCGILTAAPLSFFADAATKIPLFLVGIFEYLSPSISLVIGIFILNEAFDKVQFIAFVIVWIGLAYFTYGEIKGHRRSINIPD